jgi:hypothetical protein
VVSDDESIFLHADCLVLHVSFFHSFPFNPILGCGVCSSAQDFWARIDNFDTLETNSIVCATTFTLSTGSDRFNKLIQCYRDMGFTTPCATMWAHSAAVSTIQCGVVCLPDASGITTLNLDSPPTCLFAACLQCSADFQVDFDILAGRTLYNSGITERIVRSCDVFTRIEHDHCVGVELGDDLCDGGGVAPTPTPPGDSSSGAHLSVALVGFGGLATLMWNTLML